ncbi:MAG: cyclomaltodextrinase N-terminal domain-containing protein [Bacteroidales bacterium]|nr:cyclomaltodextrinase N-terminal domain-containing protein [Bacteroidales bacterium]
MKKCIPFLILFYYHSSPKPQVTIDHVEPPNWWIGMKNNTVQLMVHGNSVGRTDPKVDVKGVKIKKYQKAGSDYMFIDLQIGKDVKPCTVKLSFMDEGKALATWNYELKARETGSAQRGASLRLTTFI